MIGKMLCNLHFIRKRHLSNFMQSNVFIYIRRRKQKLHDLIKKIREYETTKVDVLDITTPTAFLVKHKEFIIQLLFDNNKLGSI